MNLGMPEMIFIFLLALVVVGPKRLPGLARQLGKYMAEFKRASNEFKNQLETEMMNIELEERAKKQAEAPKILPPEKPAGTNGHSGARHRQPRQLGRHLRRGNRPERGAKSRKPSPPQSLRAPNKRCPTQCWKPPRSAAPKK